MNTLLARIALSAALTTSAFAATSANAASIDSREAWQRGRIARGVADGCLNRYEAARLTAQQNAIERREAVYRSTGGHLSRGERYDLERRLDWASANIARESHDSRGCR